jgi:hypothetical protein
MHLRLARGCLSCHLHIIHKLPPSLAQTAPGGQIPGTAQVREFLDDLHAASCNGLMERKLTAPNVQHKMMK